MTKLERIDELKEFIDTHNLRNSKADIIQCDRVQLTSLIQQTIEEEREKAWRAGFDTDAWDMDETEIHKLFSDWQKQNKIKL